MVKTFLLRFDLASEADKKLYNKLMAQRNKTRYIKDLISKDDEIDIIRDIIKSTLSEYFEGAELNKDNLTTHVEAPDEIEETLISAEPEPVQEPTEDSNNTSKLGDNALSFLDSLGSFD